MDYRLYLLDEKAAIQAADWFRALDDDEAMSVGAALYAVVDDVFSGYEVWQGDVSIIKSPVGPYARAVKLREKVIDLRQQNIVALEESLSNSWDCVKKSRKLLDATTRMLDQHTS